MLPRSGKGVSLTPTRLSAGFFRKIPRSSQFHIRPQRLTRRIPPSFHRIGTGPLVACLQSKKGVALLFGFFGKRVPRPFFPPIGLKGPGFKNRWGPPPGPGVLGPPPPPPPPPEPFFDGPPPGPFSPGEWLD